ncbi:MAG: alpha-ketoglutarate-dependent dioxygenase AlkB [Alphaproteobacteria bacterium]|nr:alpha-ketoglutarate-dependent dioxygenase AlkB [Alphaproteobacteria bacterium]
MSKGAADSGGRELPPGVKLWRGLVTNVEQHELAREVFRLAAAAPFYKPRMPRTDRPFSVEQTNFGTLGWYSDRSGYRYVSEYPRSARGWPAIPPRLLRLWETLLPGAALPESCLVNLYRGSSRMGLHQDRDETALEIPVLSLSLGDDAIFRIGSTDRRASTHRIKLGSGDAIVFGGPSRLAFHGIERVIGGTSDVVPGGGRLNLTLRRVRREKKTPDQGADRASYAPLRADAGRG